MTCEIRPQPGPQEAFLSNPADIVIYGGAAGGGKTWALLMEPLRHIHNSAFSAVMFRRTYPEVTNPGGMWSESSRIYPLLGAKPNSSGLSWSFPSGAGVRFGHLQHEKDIHSWLGAQIALIGFDQLERFTEQQFFYMLSRNRSTCGVRPYVRATANPEPGWLADLLAWWIDPDTGYPVPERAGVVRWFARRDNLIEWGDSAEDLQTRFPETQPKSLAFVPAKVTDNPALLKADPSYIANLLALPHIEQLRLLGGNWKINSDGGEWPADYFSSSIWFDDWPPVLFRVLALDPSKGKDAKHSDYSAFVIVGIDREGALWVDADLERRPIQRIVDDGLDLYRRHQPRAFAVEVNQFQSMLAADFKRAAREQQMGVLPIYGITNTLPKPVRIRTIGSYLAQGEIRFKADSPGGRLLVQQLREFPTGEHDDGPDSLHMAITMIKYMLGQKSERKQPGQPELIR